MRGHERPEIVEPTHVQISSPSTIISLASTASLIVASIVEGSDMARSASFLRGRTHRPYRTASFMIVFCTKGRLPRSSFLTYTRFGIHQWYVKFGLAVTAAYSLRLSVIRKAVKIESK